MNFSNRFAGIGLAVLLVAGCDKAPEGQTVAVVNGEEISLSELNAELASVNVPATADKKEVMPQLLQRVLERRLMAQEAEEQGVGRTPQFLAQERRLREELLIRQLGEKQGQAIKAPDAQAVAKFIADNPGMFQKRTRYSLDQLAFDPPADPTLLNALRDDRSLGEIEQTLTSLGIRYTRNKGLLDTATLPPQVVQQIQSVPPGEPFVVPVRGQFIASVITGQEPVGTDEAQNRQAATEMLKRQQLQTTLEKQLEQARKEAKIEYQAGYAPKQAKGGVPSGGQATPKAR